MPSPRFTQEQLEEAIQESRSWAETLRRLRYRSAGGNWRTLQKYAVRWNIATDHFDSAAAANDALRRPPRPLESVLVEGSTYSRSHLKERLFAEGLKDRRCEICGQDEIWRGLRMALILDHINGVPNDHRLSNLRVVCPNCAATLHTHCGRKNRRAPMPRNCARCSSRFFPKYGGQRYCSRACGIRWDRRGKAVLGARRVERPPHSELILEIERLGYEGVGRRYGVSGSAIRKWVAFYERENTGERSASS
ncbi:MAG: hypothetical protein QOJ38_110 [Solirubrobacterales bacterium]|jgi:hypothetical protein|nr:hypothetical protein [Solirubrobacterales bacterium]